MKTILMMVLSVALFYTAAAAQTYESLTASEFDDFLGTSVPAWTVGYQAGGSSGQESHEIYVYTRSTIDLGQHSWDTSMDTVTAFDLAGNISATVGFDSVWPGADAPSLDPFDAILFFYTDGGNASLKTSFTDVTYNGDHIIPDTTVDGEQAYGILYLGETSPEFVIEGNFSPRGAGDASRMEMIGIQVIPEPSVFALAALSVLGVFRRKR